MSDRNFVSSFIFECSKKGLSSASEISEAAILKIKEIDAILAEADRLRPVKTNLLSVVKSFGGEEPKIRKRIISDLTRDELDETSLSILNRIFLFLEKKNSTTPRELMNAFGITSDRDAEVYSVIKWMCMNGYCTRNKQGDLLKGPNWGKYRSEV